MTPTDSAEKVVAEWRAAMEGVTPGPWKWWTSCSWRRLSSAARGYDRDGGVICPIVSRSDGHPDLIVSDEDMAFIARCSPSGISGLLALIERVERERDDEKERADMHARQMINQNRRIEAAEARVTALEAEKAGLVKALTDPVAVHRNMLAGTIAKPSTMNIAHLYPEVQQMRQALIATLKHFRHPTSAEHETRDKVMAALGHFDDPPLTPMFQALSRSSTEVKNDDL